MQEQQGLASTMAPTDNQTLQQVIDMLLAGADPDELVQQGIPVELVQAAVEAILSQQPASPTDVPASPAGVSLADSAGLASTGLR